MKCIIGVWKYLPNGNAIFSHFLPNKNALILLNTQNFWSISKVKTNQCVGLNVTRRRRRRRGYLEELHRNHRIDKQSNRRARGGDFHTLGNAPTASWSSPPLELLWATTRRKGNWANKENPWSTWEMRERARKAKIACFSKVNAWFLGNDNNVGKGSVEGWCCGMSLSKAFVIKVKTISWERRRESERERKRTLFCFFFCCCSCLLLLLLLLSFLSIFLRIQTAKAREQQKRK